MLSTQSRGTCSLIRSSNRTVPFLILLDDHNQLDCRRFWWTAEVAKLWLFECDQPGHLLVARDIIDECYLILLYIGYHSTTAGSRRSAVCLSVWVDGETRTRSFLAPPVEPHQTITRDLWHDRDFETFGPRSGVGPRRPDVARQWPKRARRRTLAEPVASSRVSTKKAAVSRRWPFV